MGVTVDLIPRLSDESPEEAVARIYSGEVSLHIESESVEADAGERPEVVRRLRELFPHWEVEDHDDDLCTLWADGYLWRIELNEDDITLRARRHVDLKAPAATDAELLAEFEGLHTIVHWPQGHGSHAGLDRTA